MLRLCARLGNGERVDCCRRKQGEIVLNAVTLPLKWRRGWRYRISPPMVRELRRLRCQKVCGCHCRFRTSTVGMAVSRRPRLSQSLHLIIRAPHISQPPPGFGAHAVAQPCAGSASHHHFAEIYRTAEAGRRAVNSVIIPLSGNEYLFLPRQGSRRGRYCLFYDAVREPAYIFSSELQ